MYEPDILPAGHAIAACLDAWQMTQDLRWLQDAVYWAETGVPFIYLWSLPDKPMMLGATIPVFGSTFYTHTWLGVPVQWNGLVYSYHLAHLAEVLETATIPSHASILPTSLEFSAADWKRIVQHITVSACYQQFADGPNKGSYPDSIGQFEKPNPAFINPEDILVNMLALSGHDPDIQSVSIPMDSARITLSSAAKITNASLVGGKLQFQLKYDAGDNAHVLVSGIKPKQMLVQGKELALSPSPVQRTPGWSLDVVKDRAYLCIPLEKGQAEVTLVL
jgi:hypothetical protein